MIAFGTHEGLSKIDIGKVQKNGKVTAKKPINLGMSSALIGLDWSQDSSIVVVNS